MKEFFCCVSLLGRFDLFAGLLSFVHAWEDFFELLLKWFSLKFSRFWGSVLPLFTIMQQNFSIKGSAVLSKSLKSFYYLQPSFLHPDLMSSRHFQVLEVANWDNKRIYVSKTPPFPRQEEKVSKTVRRIPEIQKISDRDSFRCRLASEKSNFSTLFPVLQQFSSQNIWIFQSSDIIYRLFCCAKTISTPLLIRD